MDVRKEDVVDLLRAHGIEAVRVRLQERRGQRPALLSVTLECESSAKRLYQALRASTGLEIGQGRDERDRFIVNIFGTCRC